MGGVVCNFYGESDCMNVTETKEFREVFFPEVLLYSRINKLNMTITIFEKDVYDNFRETTLYPDDNVGKILTRSQKKKTRKALKILRGMGCSC